jgi:hypothetical protein
MKKILTLGAVLLGCCLFAAAQTGYQNEAPLATLDKNQAMSQTTVRGCLSQSADGTFLLAADSGLSYQLVGDEAKLGRLVGDEIRVHGSASNITALPNGAAEPNPMEQASNTPDAMALPAGSITHIKVGRVKRIADHCPSDSGVRQ